MQNLDKNFKKPVLILAISAPIIETSKKDNISLQKVFYIYYSIQFKKDKLKVLIYFGSKINTIMPAYISKLSLKICYTKVKIEKIDSFNFKMFKIVLASF